MNIKKILVKAKNAFALYKVLLTLFVMLFVSGMNAQWSQIQKITASDGEVDDQFGLVSAISSDGSIVVVTAPDGDAAYVFENDGGGTWSEIAILTASDGASGDYFGSFASISPDGSIVVIGAPDQNSYQGAAYVFEKPIAGWSGASTETAKLVASDGSPNDYFGDFLSISSDGSTIIVGADGANAAYVFENSGSGWSESTILTASDGASGDDFGYFATISSDASFVVVGAPGHNSEQGAAYVFEKPGTGWGDASNETAKLTTSDGTAGDFFGYGISISSDRSTVIACAVQYDGMSTFTGPGTAYIFENPGSGWVNAIETAKLTGSDRANGDIFGLMSSISSDGSTVIIGSMGHNTQQGAAYVYSKPSGGWLDDNTEDSQLTASDGEAGDMFCTVSMIPDASLVFIGAPGDDSWQGSSYIFTKISGGSIPTLGGCDFGGDETTTQFIGELIDNGGSTITECGFYWGTTDVIADLISGGTKVVADAIVQSGNFTTSFNNTDLPDDYYFIPYATNANGTDYGVGACSSHTIIPELSCSYYNLNSTSVTLYGTVIDDKDLEFVSFGFMIGSDPDSEPDIYPATGNADGFSVDVSSLTPGTFYYFAPYGQDAEGMMAMGESSCQFTTPTGQIPSLSGCNFAGDEAVTTFVGMIYDDGGSTITECGFYWGTTDVIADLISDGTKVVADEIVQSGNFTASFNAADLPDEYYFIPYATNANGTDYGIGACSSHTIAPEFSCSYTDLTPTTVTLEAAVIDNAALSFVSYGFMIGADVNSEPDVYPATGDASGFSVDVSSLTPNTTYYFAPYGQDADGEQWMGESYCQFITPVATNLVIPSAFTPNGDNINDYFVIEGIEAYPNNNILILNRWGNKVYETNSYNNDWDGRSDFGVRVNKNDILPEGSYFYILDLGDGSAKIKGSVYLKKH